ncbi:MAG: hypothetical protein EKK37_18000 [Sphingobacteriales bacterium]|nr:MAG: hypothetical protein EKK37_18000 [Sphingobacteriales bacterium]
MNPAWRSIAVSQYKTIEELGREETKSLAEQYPYSSFHQLLHSFKLKAADEAAYKKQISRTALYIHNLPWLEYVLNHYTNPPAETITEAKNINTSEILEEPMTDEIMTETERELEVGHEPGPGTDNLSEETIVDNNDNITEPEAAIETGDDKGHSLVSSILDREKEMADQETELKFEPLYAVDYFASQGIKHVAEQLPADKFGKQLRSFTDWLKTMKRLPAEENAEINETDEKKIKAEAEDSNEIKEVVTEAMAEVLIKQEKTHKAIEIYQKLSLQHPEKSPYFAALIEQLKQ